MFREDKAGRPVDIEPENMFAISLQNHQQHPADNIVGN